MKRIVIVCGIMGSCIAYHLAVAGRPIAAVQKFLSTRRSLPR